MRTQTINPGAGNYTGEKVSVEMTPSQWIEYRANLYKAQGYEVNSLMDGRQKAIIDFLDAFFKNVK